MKKIMFNEHFGLQQSVLDGTKDMTRRIIKGDFEDIKAYHANGGWHFIADTKDGDSVEVKPAYEVGGEVAIAQAYANDDVLTFNAYDSEGQPRENGHKRHQEMLASPGYKNKMFVKAEYMPHRIKNTNVRLERLQDISDEDCLREGIHEGEFMNTWDKYYFDEWGDVPNHITFKTPREAFAALIDRISGKGTWQRNPWVYAYEFKLLH